MILEALGVESNNGYVHKLYQKFKDTLIHDMTEVQFADMYAQTVVYGLFSARCMDESQDNFSAAEAIDCIPNTNPFLKSLMKECLGAQEKSGLSFDELEIGDVVDLLQHTKTDAIIQDFNRQTGGGREDPVIHFYEEFLTAYDKEQKVQRGVYYTPQPIVNFIIRAVDDILKTEFDLEDGLASTTRKTVRVTRRSLRKVGGTYKDVEDTEEVPAIQVLDPATGTGTFLRQAILQVYENFVHMNKGKSVEAIQAAWNEYVPRHLLPRLNGFELMMAPYAVAHMKLAMVLKDTGYCFGDNSRLNVYLTNSLEEPGSSDKQISLWDDPLAAESVEANVVIGNPPYNVSSTNKNDWINRLIQDYKVGLTERKLNLDDDYIKFIRLAQSVVDNADYGVVGFITNNSYIDGITHRQIRKSLLRTFSTIYIIDLHGNVMKHEKAPNGERDENVFDITQGVCICLMVKNRQAKNPGVYHFDLMGTRQRKYDALNSKRISDIDWIRISPDNDKCLFIPFNSEGQADYKSGVSVADLFPLYNSGIQTKCDSLSVGITEAQVSSVIENFRTMSITALRSKYPDKTDSSGWTFAKAKAEIMGGSYRITPYYYRPFDVKYTVYTGKSGGFIGRSREVVMQHIVGHEDNPCLCMMKQFFQDTLYNHVLFSNLPIDERTLYSNRGGTYIFPLYTYSGTLGKVSKSYNLSGDHVKRFEDALSLKLSMHPGDGLFTGEDLLAYIYAILYSPKFRETYNAYLKYDFPIIPLPKDAEQFFEVAKIGYQLIEIHKPQNFVRGDEGSVVFPVLTKYGLNEKTGFINLNGTDVIQVEDPDVYEYEIGGYKPIQKWLKDRKSSALYRADIETLQRIVGAIEATRRIVPSIDDLLFR